MAFLLCSTSLFLHSLFLTLAETSCCIFLRRLLFVFIWRFNRRLEGCMSPLILPYAPTCGRLLFLGQWSVPLSLSFRVSMTMCFREGLLQCSAPVCVMYRCKVCYFYSLVLESQNFCGYRWQSTRTVPGVDYLHLDVWYELYFFFMLCLLLCT